MPRSLALALFLLPACGGTSGEVVFADPEQGMVVGGWDADIADHASLVSIQSAQGDHVCGGTLIDPFWVLTAAHCLDWMYVGGVQVEVGSEVLGEGAIHDVVAWMEHPDYVTWSKEDDIALLRLGYPVEGVAPMPMLTRQGEEVWALPDTPAITAGWGYTDLPNLVEAEGLQEVEVPLLDLDDCIDAYAPDKPVVDTMVCAGDLVNGGIDACVGDSGGPLTVETDVGPALVGVVSWGEGCAEPGHPGVYTRMSPYINWVQHEVWGAELDDFGDAHANAEPVPVDGDLAVAGSFLEGDLDTFALSTTERHEVVITTTSTLDITARVVADDGTLLAHTSGVGDVTVIVELDGDATLELEATTPGDYDLDITSTSLEPAASSDGGCGGSNLWTLLGTVVMGGGRRRGRALRVGRHVMAEAGMR